MAIRFKNGGTGQTAEGAILVANPDEFRDALNYQNNNASGNCFKYIELEADLDLNYSVDWYYRMKDIFNVNALRNVSGSLDRKVVINGMGHSITNIYVYPNCAVFGTNSDSRQSSSLYQCILEINDITFEAIIQKGGGFFSGNSRQSWPESAGYRLALIPRTNGCIFNIKFDNSYDYSTNYMYLFDYSTSVYTLSTSSYTYPRAVNCIFNIYISAQSVNHRPLFKCNSDSTSDFGSMTVFESCEFRIRNNTDKLICIFQLMNNYKFLIDNCAIFFADIKQYDDPNQRTSSILFDDQYISADSRHLIGRYENYSGYIKALFYNSYIAAFGDDFNSGHNDPIYFYLSCTDTNQIIPATSFYDKNKIFIGAQSEYVTSETTGFSALTTAQCKDKTTLSNIGYLFAEEV